MPDYIQSEIQLFVDDTLLFKIFDDMDQAANELNNDLNSVNAWAKKWLVTFNPAKTNHFLLPPNTINVSTITFWRGNSQRSYCL